jgi:hypothetical protein
MIVEMDIWNPDFLKIAGDFAGNFAGKIAGKIAYIRPPCKFRDLPKYQSYHVACKSEKDKKETLRYIKRSVFLSAWGRYLGIFSCKIPCNF